MSTKSSIAILCSGVTLGVYNPGLVLRNRLRAMGQPCRVYVLENLLDHQRRENIPQIKKAFHRNFSLALNSQKMTGDISGKFDSARVEECLDEWMREGVRNFCVFSGFWLPLVKRFRQEAAPASCKVNLCYMDAVPSTSWKPFLHEIDGFHGHRLFDHAGNKVACQLAVAEREAVPAGQREERFVVHGGGWGMGGYQRAAGELAERGIPMDVICYEPNDVKDRGEGSRNFMIDPRWNPWEPVDGDHVFPPFAEVKAGETPEFAIPASHPDVYDLTARALGIISKPGGATLLDSFSSATPLIFLPETFGEYEKKNGELWQSLGFGIDFPAWRETGYSTALLRELHENILRYKEKHQPPLLQEEITRAA